MFCWIFKKKDSWFGLTIVESDGWGEGSRSVVVPGLRSLTDNPDLENQISVWTKTLFFPIFSILSSERLLAQKWEGGVA